MIVEPRGACPQGQPCEGPTPGVTVVFTRNGHTKRVRTNNSGAYRLTLDPGLYTVSSPAARPPRGSVSPSKVRVYAGRYRRVDFLVVTGVRPQ
jgi:Carboxypeptidase regulatory-like domain